MMPNSPKQAYCTKFLLRMRTQPPAKTHTTNQKILKKSNFHFLVLTEKFRLW